MLDEPESAFHAEQNAPFMESPTLFLEASSDLAVAFPVEVRAPSALLSASIRAPAPELPPRTTALSGSPEPGTES